MTNEKLDLYSKMVNNALEEYLSQSADYLFPRLAEAMRYSLMNAGKRIRPALTLAFCELVSGNLDPAIPFACAVEMIHTYSLIHDDLPCMDDDDVRRGKPSNHKVYGEDLALLAGDSLLTKAFEVAALGDPTVVPKAVKTLAELAGTNGMVGGQCLDLESERKSVGIDVLERIDNAKTVALISSGCQLGVLAAKGSKDEQDAAINYAHGLGMAFQIRDDILDIVGDEEKLGKSIGSDNANEKSTYVSLLGLEKAQEMVNSYTKKAIDALDVFVGDTSFLIELAQELATREK